MGTKKSPWYNSNPQVNGSPTSKLILLTFKLI
jgi:hypothetical protein